MASPLPYDDSSLAADWLARFLTAHPTGEVEAFGGWAAGQGELVSDEALRKRVLQQLQEWRRSAELLGLGIGDASSMSFFGRPGDRGKRPAFEGDAAALHPGKRVGRFVLKSFLARGGMGQVWVAEETDLRREVALKLVLPECLETRALDLFAREARAGGRLNHPNLVTTLAYGTDEGLSWIAQELIEGSWTLKDFLDHQRAAGRLPDRYYPRIADLIAQLADALHAAHEAGVIHRDVKPANILIAPDGRPMLTDFGLARVADDSMLSVTGDFAGTWAYMSPEQVTAKRMGLDHRTDVFSLGVVLYELLALIRPFEGDTTHQIAERIISFDPPEASKIRSQCPRDLAVICAKALQKSPGQRYQSAEELASDLRRHLADEPIVARPAGPVEIASKWIRRNPTISAACGVGLVALLVVSILAVRNKTLADRNAVQTALSEQSADEALRRAEEAGRERTRAEQLLQQRNEALAAEQARSRELVETAGFLERQLGGLDVAAMGQAIRSGLWSKIEQRLARVETPLEEQEAARRDYERLVAGADLTGLALDTLDATYFTPALNALEIDFGQQPELRSRLLVVIGYTLTEVGLLDRALPALQEGVDLQRQLLDPDDPDTLAAIGHLGSVLVRRGELQDARRHFEECLEGYLRVEGLDSPETLRAMNNVGRLLVEVGEFDEAVEILTECLERRQRTLGPEHEEVPATINNLANAYGGKGDLERADALYQESLQLRRKIFGDDDRGTLLALSNLAGHLRERNELEEAEACFREALEGQRRLLGDDHPQTQVTLSGLSGLLRERGELVEAEQLLRELLATRRLLLGPEHPKTLNALNSMGVLCKSAGRFEDAAVYFREALETSRSILGAGDRTTVVLTFNLGNTLRELGQLEEAERLSSSATELGRVSYGPTHYVLGVFMIEHARALTELARFSEAEGQALAGQELLTQLDPGHRHVINALSCLVSLYEAWDSSEPGRGRAEQAEIWSVRLQEASSDRDE